MVFVPGTKLFGEMNSERSGLWFGHEDLTQELFIVAKLPTPLIKAVYSGAPSSVILSVVRAKQHNVRIIGIRVDDDLDRPFFATHPSVTLEEHTNVEEVLTYSHIRMHFFDERTRPVLSLSCSVDQAQVKQALIDFSKTRPHYASTRNSVAQFAHDLFQADQEKMFLSQKEPAHTLVSHHIPLSLTTCNPIKVFEPDRGEFQIDDRDEGDGFEQSVHGSLAYVFPNSTYRSPQVGVAAHQRELTDLLAFESEIICLGEAKAFSVLNTNPTRSTNRRASTIEKDVQKALRQLKGAIRRIRAGDPIYDLQQHTISIPHCSDATVYALIVISEMNPFVDWSEVARSILEASDEWEKTFFYVLDLQELQRLAISAEYPRSSASIC